MGREAGTGARAGKLARKSFYGETRQDVTEQIAAMRLAMHSPWISTSR